MKRFFLFFVVLAIFAVMAVPVFAEEPATTTVEASAVETTAPAVVTAAPIVEDPTEAVEKSLVDEIGEALGEFVPEMMSGATLAGIGLLALLVKKKLIPSITDALAKMFKFAKENGEKNAADIVEVKGNVYELLTRFEGIATVVEASQKNLCAEVELIAETSCDLSESIVELLNNTDSPAEAKAKIAAAHEKHTAAMNAVREKVTKHEE